MDKIDPDLSERLISLNSLPMLKSKTLEMLRTLSTWERKKLEEYLHSPYFNKNESVLALWKLILAYAPAYHHDDLEMEKVFATLFPDTAYDHQALRYIMTDLNRLCEGFLAHKAWEEDPISYNRYLMDALDARNLPKAFEEKSRKLGKALARTSDSTHSRFNDRFLYTEKAYSASRDLLKGRGVTYQVSEVMHALDELYLVKKLRYSCELINQSNVLNKPYEFFLTEELVRQMAERPELGGGLARLYYQALLMLGEGEDSSHFYALKETLETSLDKIGREDLSDLYVCALNYCIKQMNLGKGQFSHDLYDLYRVCMEKQFFFSRDILSERHYKNMVTIGSRVEAYDWTETFIEMYRQYLNAEEQANAYTYNMAFLQFAKGDLSRVKKLLMAVEFTNFSYQVGSRSILIRTYYELEDFEALLYLLKSFRIYLQRSREVPNYQRKPYLNLIRITHKLVKYRLGARVKVGDIEDLLKKHPDVAAAGWVEQKIEELE